MSKTYSQQDLRRNLLHSSRSGIETAEIYIKQLANQFGNDQAAGLFYNSKSVKWSGAVKQSRSELTYHCDGMDVVSVFSKAASNEVVIDQSSSIDNGAYAEYEAIIGTRMKDWDGDIVEPKGYTFDMKSPVLWMHAHGMPCGSLKSIVSRDDNMAKCRFRIADTALGRDAVSLMQVGALRKSIGFKPGDFSPLGFKKDLEGRDIPDGWHVRTSMILENSLVSIPSNMGTGVEVVYAKAVDGIRTLSGQKKFQDERIAYWAKSYDEGRASVVRGWVKPKELKEVKMDDFSTKFHGVDRYMPDCLEEITSNVSHAVDEYFSEKKMLGENYGYCYVFATYQDKAYSVIRSGCGKDSKRVFYQADFKLSGSKVEVTGVSEITITPSVTQVASEKMLEAIEGRLATKSVPVVDGTGGADERSDLRKAIAGLLIGKSIDGELVAEMRQAADAFGRLHNIAQLRLSGLV